MPGGFDQLGVLCALPPRLLDGCCVTPLERGHELGLEVDQLALELDHFRDSGEIHDQTVRPALWVLGQSGTTWR